MDCWQTLGIVATADKREIKRAYAKLVKQNNPEDDPKEFQAIREAYDQALTIADYLEHGEDQHARTGDNASRTPELIAETRQTETESIRIVHDKERVRSAQLETIQAALTKLIALLQQNEATTIEFCRSTLKNEFYQALDVRYEFEGRLLLALLQRDFLPFAFLSYLAQEFDWDIDIYRHGRMAIGHFDDDVRFSGAFYSVMQTYLVELVKRAMSANLQQAHRVLTPTEREQLEAVLFTDAADAKLAEYCRHKQNRALINSAWAFLTIHQFITPHFSFVPQATVRWLVDQKIVRPVLPIKPQTSQNQKAEETQSRRPNWMIWVAIFVSIRFVAFIANESRSNQTSDPNQREPSVFATNDSNKPKSSYSPDIYAFPREKMDRVLKLQSDAAANNAEAQYTLGLEFLRSDSVLSNDSGKALQWLRRAADQGYAPAREALGILYYTGEAGVQDYKTAADLLTWGADRDRRDATFWLSRAFAEGKGVERNAAKARELLDRANELGSTDAMRVKGINFILGRDEERNLGKGVNLLQQAADKGNVAATYQLAQEYLSGENLIVDYQQAYRRLDSLSSKQVSIAQFWLSQLYEKGLGTPKDSLRSKQLLAMARRYATPTIVNEFAWQLATHANKQLRNGELAVKLMETLLANPSRRSANMTDTLAAAYAEAGQFEKAVQAQQSALEQLPADTSTNHRREYKARLERYRRGESYGIR